MTLFSGLDEECNQQELSLESLDEKLTVQR